MPYPNLVAMLIMCFVDLGSYIWIIALNGCCYMNINLTADQWLETQYAMQLIYCLNQIFMTRIFEAISILTSYKFRDCNTYLCLYWLQNTSKIYFTICKRITYKV